MSKRMTKFLALILTLVMFLSVSTPAFAWGDVGIGNGWGRDIGEDDIRDFEPGEEPEEVEEYDYFSTFDEESGITVTVAAPMGALPLLAEVRVEPVPVEDVRDVVDEVMGYESNVLVAMDISFWLDDIEIEPEEPVRVKIAAPELEGLTDLTVVHIPDEEEPETIELITDEDELQFKLGTNEVCFESGDFSVYAVVDEGNVDPEARITVNFYNPVSATPNVPVATVYVKNSDELLGDGERQTGHTYIDDIVYDPGVGETLGEGQMFKGWSLDISNVENIKDKDTAHVFVGAEYINTTRGMTIPEIRSFLNDLQITEGDVLNVYAMVYNVYNVTYEDNNGVVLASDVVLISINEDTADYTIAHNYDVQLSTEYFEGWQVKSGAANIEDCSLASPPYPMGTTMKIKGDVQFSTKVAVGNWLVFEENGYNATYNAPVFVKTGETANDKRPTLSADTEMKRPGYTFGGWYVLKEGVDIKTVPQDDDKNYIIDDTNFELFVWDTQLTEKVTLYAKWSSSATAKYTVVVWQQSVVDDKDATDAQKTYDFAFSAEVSNIPSDTPVSELDLSAYNGLAGNRSYTVNGKTIDFYGFKYNSTMTAKEGSGKVSIGNGVVANRNKVTPDGTTVVNLYYDRELVTFKFNINGEYTTYTQSNNGSYGLVDGVYVYTASSGNTRYYLTYPDGTPVPADTTVYYRRNSYYQWNSSATPPYYSNYTYEDINDQTLTWKVYSGDRYSRTNGNGWHVLEERTMTGLYGQKLSKYGYTWYTDYRWFNGTGSGRFFASIVEMFEESVNDNPSDEFVSNWYGYTTEYNTEVRHYLQNVDGSWPTDPTHTIPTVVGNGMVFREFQGFSHYQYRIKLPDGVTTYYTGTGYNGDTLVNSTSHTAEDGYTDWLSEDTCINYNGNSRYEAGRWNATAGGIEFRYTRNVYNLTYMVGRFVNRNNEALTPLLTGELKQVSDIAYEGSLADYAKTGSQYFNPDEDEDIGPQTGFVFAGWYLDETCTTEALFDGTMPLNGVTVYGKWQQIEYRVFLKPNALINGVRDNTLDWGNDSQATNFRIAYNSKVSVPTGTRTGYEFGGWFTDEEFINPYSADTRLTDATVPATPVYDKTVDFTDGNNGTKDVDMDKWGLIPDGTTPINKDVNREWITRKLVLYARWSKVIQGAKGVGILYDANGGSNAPSDTLLYKDNVRAVAQPASTAPSADKTFGYWVVQKWENNQYVDTDVHVYPGDSYLVLVDNAQQSEVVYELDENGQPKLDGDGKPIIESARYTLQLRAEYVTKDEPLPTHIIWNANNGTGDKEQSNDVKINENIEIPMPNAELNREGTTTYVGWVGEQGKDLVWEGHEFLGWARLPSTDTSDKSLLSEDDLFLRYNKADKSFYAKVDPEETPTTEQNTYYLVGFFNGGDHTALDYQFVNGKLMVSFQETYWDDGTPKGNYVCIADQNGTWYMSDEFISENQNSGVFKKQVREKMFVPANTVLTFTLVENNDGTLTLSYTKGASAMLNAVQPPVSVTDTPATIEVNGETWTKVTYVAADEFSPYHDMYAVWSKVFYIYHSGSGLVEKVTINNSITVTDSATNTTTTQPLTVDIANRTTDGFLYGGYYASYAGVGSEFDVASATWLTPAAGTTDAFNDVEFNVLINKGWYSSTNDSGATIYNGVNATWTVDDATLELITASGNGLNIVPQAGAVYYIKEVPADKYLQPYFHYTYKKAATEGGDEPIVTAWLISDIDDQNYTETGFVFVDTNNGKATVCKSLSVTAQTSGNTIKLTPKRVFGVDNSGLLTYRRVMDNYVGLAYNEAGDVFGDNVAVFQYWVTPDGLIVTGTTSRVYTGTAAKADVGCTPTTGSSTIAVFGGNSLAVPAADNQN